MDTISSADAKPDPLYVVYGYRRDADEFAKERNLRRNDVLAVTESPDRLRGVRRQIIMVDDPSRWTRFLGGRWVEFFDGAKFINASMGLATERIMWVRQ